MLRGSFLSLNFPKYEIKKNPEVYPLRL
ncbi:hypothetical protein DQM68_04155 [Leptospira mayottensis]|uniref:Uncharacterized protein n=1 Tax=Leptospira mayottensis TaxID=1137606 RepID=A0ABM6YCX7_9LEPT|nr:hypothetical protein DQM68_04155 [Leptospira mayottensis]AXR66034.1 hypothetical protein DQM28_05305 [Leptospira mayottensis]TGN17255.1 hypothetical protein EHR03_02340 [Leptospira mayottensis]